MNDSRLPDDLAALFAAYREVVPDPEPSTEFSVRLWEKIESRQTLTYSFGRLARGFVTAAAAICVAISFFLTTPYSQPPASTYSSTYVDVLATDAAAAEDTPPPDAEVLLSEAL
ncbi:MAG: hypothetical protein ACRD7E_16940 [Bryobacteraceae bacterium]